MRLLRRLFANVLPPRARYSDEVLFAGWVHVPGRFREIIRRR